MWVVPVVPVLGVVVRTVRWCRAAAGAVAVVLVLGGVAGCSSGDAGAGASVPQYSPDDDGSGGGASAGASGAASGSAAPTALTWAPQDVTPEGLSNPDTEYTVVSIPDGLDDAGKEVVAAYVASDRSTWEIYRVMDGSLSSVEASHTEDAFALFEETYEKYRDKGWHMEGKYLTTVLVVNINPTNENEATMKVCNDQRQTRIVTNDGEDAGSDVAHTYTASVSLTRVSGSWLVSSSFNIGVDQC